MKEIIIICDGLNRPAGTERAITNFMNAAVAEYSITVYVPMQTASYFNLSPKVNIKSLGIGDVPNGSLSKIPWLWRAYWALGKALAQQPAVPVISTVFIWNCLVALVSGHRQKILLCEHINYDYHGWLRNRIRKFLYRGPKKTVVVLTERDYRRFKSDGLQAVVIPNMINLPPSIDYQADSKIVLSVGRYEYQKGLENLITAFADSRIHIKGWLLILLGSGSQKAMLSAQIEALSLTGAVQLVPPTDAVSEYYKNAGIYASASRFEAFPMTLLEAISYGLPTVAYDCQTGPREILDNGNAGCIVDNQDIKALSQSLRDMAENKIWRQDLSSKARKNSEKYTTQVIFSAWKKLLS